VTLDELDGRIGEGWHGEAPNGSHVNVVLARRGSAVHASLVAALASPRPGHLPFLACVELGAAVRPTTLVVNKATIASDEHARLTWGAAQLGIAQGVLDAVADGVLDPELCGELTVLAAVWVDPAAGEEVALRTANRAATRAAIADAARPVTADDVRALAARRESAANAYYRGA
jgi:5,6,7,8-tetrahydromethanopterin hydro-lyase